MAEIGDFGAIVLVVAAGALLALGANKAGAWLPIPAPGILLIVAAVGVELFPSLDPLSIRDVERIAVVALILILFDGGMHVGWRRFRASALPITVLGTLGTFATAGAVALIAHYVFGFEWITAGILGAALAPTDPAVMFSVLGKREIGGRTGTILEGESGANDPVGIALMIGMLELATHDDASFWVVVEEFAVEMSVGLAIGVAGAMLLLPLMRRVRLPSESLYAIQTLAAAGVIYGVTAVAHGSGFLAVFVAGILIGDARAPYKFEVERFHTALASLAEIVAFVALGLTIDLGALEHYEVWATGLMLAALLSFVARPLVVGLLLVPVRLRLGERLFVMWGGLKGAVPILLAAFAVLAAVDEADRIYGVVFVAVLFSVLVQGTSIPFVAPWLRVPMRIREPSGTMRFTVSPGAYAAGRPLRELPLGEHSWVEALTRGGVRVPLRADTVLQAGDDLVVITDVDDVAGLQRLFLGSG